MTDSSTHFSKRLKSLQASHRSLLSETNVPEKLDNGIYQRWVNPIITAEHVPLNWRYDLDPVSNPFLMERQGVNATFNAGALFFKGKYVLAVRVEGNDRKSFFAIAESANGIDNFQFWDSPIILPQANEPDTNVYDMRLIEHEDGYIYGLFCTERKDPNKPDDLSAAIAQCGIARTKDLKNWQRLPDLITYTGQQRNVVLHPEFIDGQYALYTRPQDGFINVGAGGGIGWGLTPSMENAEIKEELMIDNKVYHTIKEAKNGLGPAPIKTAQGWLHLAHGVRHCAAGLRYVLYVFLTDLERPWLVTHMPAGHFLSPENEERVGDVSNVVFSNGWIENNGQIFIYYASSDTRLHVATSSVEQLVDYAMNTPEDGLSSSASVSTRIKLIEKNNSLRN